MEIKNLFESDVSELEKKIDDLKKGNPSITHRVYKMQDTTDTTLSNLISDRVSELSEKVKAIQQTLDLIFADHVLIDGKWENTNKIAQIMKKK